MIAALPMYDWPALRPANDRFWRALARRLRDAGIAAPQRLTRQDGYTALWEHDELLFGQTCGLPFNTRLSGHVRYLATPVHDTEGCDQAHYSSAIVVRKDAEAKLSGPDRLRRRRLAVNGTDSWSGYEALRHWFADAETSMPAPHLVSGGHLHSMQAVAAGQADFAAIDAIALGLARQHLPGLAGRLAVVGWTAPMPAPPFITAGSSADRVVAALRAALNDTVAAEAGLRSALRLDGVRVLADDAYGGMIPAGSGAAIS